MFTKRHSRRWKGRQVCRDADKTSLKRDDQHRKKPYSSLLSQFPAKLVYFWPGQNICGVAATFTPFLRPLVIFIVSLQHFCRRGWENTHSHPSAACWRYGNALFIIGVYDPIDFQCTTDSRSGFLCLAEFTQPCANRRKSARAFHPAALLLDLLYFYLSAASGNSYNLFC